MNRAIGIPAVVVLVAVAAWVIAAEDANDEGEAAELAVPTVPTVAIAEGQLAAALEALDTIQAALESGDNESALEALADVRELVAEAQERLAGAKFVNSRCPIASTPIDPAHVPAHLRRHHKGKLVGFCCNGCPAAWDKLTDAEKDAKLKAAMP